jgi:hypothetical protein
MKSKLLSRMTCVVLTSVFPSWLPAQNFIADGSFESGLVLSCDQGETSDTWFQASPIDPGADTYSFDCATLPGVSPLAFGNFGTMLGAQEGLRFMAGWNTFGGEDFGTALVQPLTEGVSYRLSAHFMKSNTHPDSDGYEIYLSNTQSIDDGVLLGSIGVGSPSHVWTFDCLELVAPAGSHSNIIMHPIGGNSYVATDVWRLVALDDEPLSFGVPRLVKTGDVITLSLRGGQASSPALLLVVDINGVAMVSPVFRGLFDVEGVLSLSGTVPAGLTGIVATFQGLGIAASGRIEISSTQVMTFL